MCLDSEQTIVADDNAYHHQNPNNAEFNDNHPVEVVCAKKTQ